MISDYFKFAVGNLFHRKMRSWLTVIGIFIGIAAVVALISLSQGMQDAIGDVFAGLGSDRVLITPKGITGPPGTETSSSRLTEDDLDAVLKTRGVKEAAGIFNRILAAEFYDDTGYPLVVGVPTDDGLDVFLSLRSYEIERGKILRKGDTKKAIVGAELAKEGGMFDEAVDLGKTISIEGTEFEVIGILKTSGSALFDSEIVVPQETVREIVGIDNELSVIHAVVNEGEDIEEVAARIKENLRKSRGLEKGNEDFEAQTSQQLLQTVSSILGMVQAIILGIAAISLLVGAIGIMNTMYTAVLERTNEIGIMKAIGAKNSDILTIFMIESGLLGLVGGIIGVIAGITLSTLVEIGTYAAWGSQLIAAHYSWELMLGALAFSFFIGSISGVLPAIQASRMQPVNALRYE